MPLKPVYFPHTYLPPAVAAAIRASFASVVAYQPIGGRLPADMRRLAESGFLDIVAPGSTDDPRLELLNRELEQWGRLHYDGAGLHAAVRFSRCGQDAGSDDDSPAALVSEIKRCCGSSPVSEKEEPFMRARVFLHLAQQADFQAHRLQEDLVRFEKEQAALFESLTGESPPRAAAVEWAGAHGHELPPERLIKQRIEAWARLYLRHPYPSSVFITASAEAIDLLAERHPAMRRISGVDVPQDPAGADLMSRLAILTSTGSPAVESPFESREGVHLEDRAGAAGFYFVPDIPPLRLFAGLAARDDSETEAPAAAESWRHTVILRLT